VYEQRRWQPGRNKHADSHPHFSPRHLPARLRRLIGAWTIEGQFVGGDEIMDVRGTATSRWLVKDALVVQHIV
jgi:hypothetical protein